MNLEKQLLLTMPTLITDHDWVFLITLPINTTGVDIDKVLYYFSTSAVRLMSCDNTKSACGYLPSSLGMSPGVGFSKQIAVLCQRYL